MLFDGTRRLKGGVGLRLQRLQFRQQRTQRNRGALERERGAEFGELRFAERLADVEETVLGLGGGRKAAASVEQRNGAAESGRECANYGGRVCPTFFGCGVVGVS